MNPRKRSGSIALMLVLVLTLLFGTFVVSIVRLAAHQRRAELEHQSVTVLESAIDAAVDFDFTNEIRLQLPINGEQKTWVIVERVSTSDSENKLRATLYRNEKPTLTIDRERTSPK